MRNLRDTIQQCFKLVVWICYGTPAIWASHNRAGEIHVRQIGGCNSLTVEVTVITWTRTSSVNADRDSVIVCWGDGKCQTVARSNGNGKGEPKPNDIKYNEYKAQHTYAGPATYRISMTDPNRIANIINVNPPSSDNVQFHIETIYTFQDPQFGGCNTTPYLLQPPVDEACVGYPFRHNPNAYDPDGDSLSFEFFVPLADFKTPVPLYSFPNQIVPGPENQLQLDPIKGDLLWWTPRRAGEYNLAIIIISWRNGQPIDTTIRDMQILVKNCENHPPIVKAPDQLCVVAGTVVEFDVVANDPDTLHYVQLTALGGPFSTKYSPATFSAPAGFRLPTIKGKFRWQTTCEHISNQPYSVVFKAVDSVSQVIPKLADLATTFIKVVAPPPEDVQSRAEINFVEISWQKPYRCEDAADNYFYGFSVWRREGSNPFVPDTCSPGLAGKGYTELIFVTRQMANGRYVFVDKHVEPGRTYCYRVLAKFARRSTAGYPYNIVSSLPSAEVCVQLPRSLPLITQVDVKKTHPSLGAIEVSWTKPIAKDLDTLLNPPPYRYVVRRAPQFKTSGLEDVPNGAFTASSFWLANDTVFVDQNINTTQPYTYEIAFYVGNKAQPLGTTHTASSVFLSITPSDNANQLSWKAEVPWGNYRYVIFRKNSSTGVFDSIGTTTATSFMDKKLLNGVEYCYFVRSIGTYSVKGVVNPIINHSQEVCSIPNDKQPPCAPTLTVTNLCNTGNNFPPDPPYENLLTWTNPNQTCPNTDDVLKYSIYYSPTKGGTFNTIATIDGANNVRFTHFLDSGLAGCYAVSAIDSFGNESEKSLHACVDNCPDYRLPNAFTPDGDGANDIYTPFPGWRFIESVEMKIFGRWGNLIFETNDPAIRWDGTTPDGKRVASGTYFYVCKIYERRVDGIMLRPEPLKGFIEVFQNQ